jgi:hypothetical protein
MDRRLAAEAAERRLRQQQEAAEEIMQASTEPLQQTENRPSHAAADAAERRFLDQKQDGGDDETKAEQAGVSPASGNMSPVACVICFESIDQDSPKGGIVCPAGYHFTCDDCFSSHVSSQSSMEPGKLTQRRGRVMCPLSHHGCSQDAYPHTDIARRVPEQVFGEYMAACERSVEARVLSEEQQHAAAKGRSNDQQTQP